MGVLHHVSNLKKCLADPTLKVPFDEIQVDAKLNFVEEPVEILEREFKKLKCSRIAIVKFLPLSGCDILSLPDGVEDFVVYCDASNQGLANVVADALSRNKRVKPKRIRIMAMTIQSGVKGMILATQGEAFNQENVFTERYSVYPGADKMYYDLQDMYWWPGMKRDIATYVRECLTCAKVPEWKWESITMNFITKLPRTRNGHDAIWVVVDTLTKLAHFLEIREDYSTEKLERLYTKEIVAHISTAYHLQTDGQSERIIQTLEDMLRACVIDFGGSWDVRLPLAEFSYNNTYHTSIQCALFEALYGRKCRSPVLWAKIGEGSLIGPELVQETTDKVVVIKEKLKVARDHQKSYVDNRRKLLEFEFGDRVILKCRLGRAWFILGRMKCLADASLHVPLDEIKVDKTLRFIEESVEIIDRETKSLKRSKISLMKVRWNSKRGPEFTWEREDCMKSKYPQLFVDHTNESAS
ncbi:putative reverse transcriptase domain-containing protein [Tanacetum coccineum]